MKYISALFVLALLSGCTEEVAPKVEGCRLTKIVVGTTQTTYAYNSDGKIDKQVRTRNGTTVFDYTYSYGSDGKVVRVDDIASYSLNEFGAGGKIASVSEYSKDGSLSNKFLYTWSGETVEIKLTKPGLPNPYQIIENEFLNGNVVRTSYKIFTGMEPNTQISFSESRYEDFDTSLSAFYVASLARPGYSAIVSKNNPRKQVDLYKQFDPTGNVTQENTNTTTFSYTYNSSNATVSSTATSNGAAVLTEITYDKCN